MSESVAALKSGCLKLHKPIVSDKFALERSANLHLTSSRRCLFRQAPCTDLMDRASGTIKTVPHLGTAWRIPYPWCKGGPGTKTLTDEAMSQASLLVERRRNLTSQQLLHQDLACVGNAPPGHAAPQRPSLLKERDHQDLALVPLGLPCCTMQANKSRLCLFRQAP